MKTPRKPSGDYEVGYGKPPVSGQFKPGQSGNRKGRPKGSKDFATLLKAALEETVTVKEGGLSRRRSKKEVMTKVLVNKALNGDIRAWLQLFNMSREAGFEQVAAEPSAPPLAADHAAIIERALAARMAPDEDDDAEEAA